MKKSILKSGFIVSVALLLLFCGCENNNSYAQSWKIPVEMFSNEVLEEYQIPWLVKPANVSNEEQYYLGYGDTENYYGGVFYYSAYMGSSEEFLEYVSSVYSCFAKSNLTLASFGYADSDGELWNSVSFYRLRPANSLDAFKRELNNKDFIYYEFHFTELPLGEFDVANYVMTPCLRCGILLSRNRSSASLVKRRESKEPAGLTRRDNSQKFLHIPHKNSPIHWCREKKRRRRRGMGPPPTRLVHR